MNSKPFIEKIKYLGLDCVAFGAGGYSAIAALYGGNVISLKYLPKNMDILRCPEKVEDYIKSTQTYGAAPLFPPNRINEGEFIFEDRKYRFPINTPFNTHLHGFVKDDVWQIESMETTSDKAILVLSYKVLQDCDVFRFFGHRFELYIENILSKDGLNQKLTVKNLEDYPMPFGFAYHTTFNIPFNTSPKEAFFVQANLKNAYKINNGLPTGEFLDLSDSEKQVCSVGYPCLGEVLDNLYLADDSKQNISIITDKNTGGKVIYEADNSFKHWILYNNDAASGYLCIEPQTWCTNAPNLSLKEANVISVPPKGDFTLTTRLYAN